MVVRKFIALPHTNANKIDHNADQDHKNRQADGQADPVVPAEFSRRMILAIGEAGGRPRYTELRGQGHEIWDQVYSDPKLFDWLFAQRRHVTPSPTAGVAYK